MPDLLLLIDDLEKDIKDAKDIIDSDPGPLSEPELSNATSELDQAATHADNAMQDPSLVGLHPTYLNTPWPSGANNKVALAVGWAEDAQTASTDQEKADLIGSVQKIITFIKTDIGA